MEKNQQQIKNSETISASQILIQRGGLEFKVPTKEKTVIKISDDGTISFFDDGNKEQLKISLNSGVELLGNNKEKLEKIYKKINDKFNYIAKKVNIHTQKEWQEICDNKEDEGDK